MKKQIFTLMTLLLTVCSGAWSAVTWPDANYLLLDGITKNQIATGNSNSYTDQVGGTGATWSCNTSKYSYGNTACTFYGNAFTKGLKSESATYTQVVTTGVSTLTIVQSLATNSEGSLDIETVGSSPSDRADINDFDADNLLVSSYTGTNTVDGKTYKDVKVFKLCNLPAGTYKIYRASANSTQTYVVYMGVTYGATAKVAIETATSNGGASTVAGAGTFLVGKTVTLTATPAAGKAFDHWELGGSSVSTDNPYSFTVSAAATYTAVFADAATKSITATSNNATYGSADATVTTVPEGGSTTLTATPAGEAYYFVNWTKSSDGSWSNTTNPLEIAYDAVTDGETYTANFAAFKKITYSVGTFEKGTQTSYQNGTMTKYADNAGNITMPNNYAFVYSADFDEAAGYTLKYWSNGGPNYAVGSNYTLAEDVTALVPVFAANTVSLAELSAPQTVTWNFASNASAPDVHVEGNTGYYVTQTTIGGTTIDVPMYITGSKFNMTETRAQVNATTNFKVLAVKGMVITYTADSGSPAAADFGYDDESNVEFSADGKIATITYNGTNSSLTISDKNGNFWPKSLEVTYPISIVSITPAYEKTTYVTTMPLDFTGVDGLKAYVATSATASAVTMEEVTAAVPAGTPLVLIGTAGTAYSVPVAATASAPAVNLLKAGDGTTAFDGSTPDYILASDGKFHQISEGTVAVGKAYLHVDGGDARELDILFGGETTGISEECIVKSEEFATAPVYNLNGQRVTAAQKGLYIVNGKKVVVK